jgi:protein-disulfide isomerase
MKLTSVLTAGIFITSMNVSIAKAATELTFDPAQKKQFEQVIHDYLVTNPDVLIEASQALQKKQQEMMQKDSKVAITANSEQLTKGNLAVAGNEKGNVTLVEFFDYQCSHCKNMEVVVDGLIKNNKDLKVIYKEFPIFGKASEMASKVAIASAMQGKYMVLQGALLKEKGRLDEARIMEIAKQSGLNMEKLKTDMDSKEVTDTLKDNRALAEKIHLMGTPAFVVISTPNGKFKPGSEISFVPGAASQNALQELIEKAKK